jgi:hypothetical protein
MKQYAYIMGMKHAVKYARKLRSEGLRLKRIRRGHWIILSPHFPSEAKIGDDLYISQSMDTDDIYQVEKPTMMFKQPKIKFDTPERQLSWRLRYRYGLDI